MASILRAGAGLAAALALLPASAPVSATGSGLYGTVRKGPVTPVCRQGAPCDAPARVTLAFSKTTPAGAATGTRAVVRQDAQGRYRIALDPGYYVVSATKKVGMTRLPRPHAVHVRRGHWDRINLFFDTGIR